MKFDLNFIIQYGFILEHKCSIKKLKPAWKYISNVDYFKFGDFCLVKDYDEPWYFYFKKQIGCNDCNLRYDLNKIEFITNPTNKDFVMTFSLEECCYFLNYNNGLFTLDEEKCLEKIKISTLQK